ncbi:hypothetical protein XU18_3263 [Perkinsela sp. CCAP 1560/4]|nr:hypothetical protein XU18_3263 [Perkinsela sp. CCAP 1560/4]|eukprot:KNH05741.1 hypothetical protein XU18_3263 [Perkinsela sp. CCAP 1560/4]
MINSFQYLEQQTSQLLDQKARQTSESKQLDEKIERAVKNLQRSIRSADDLCETMKEKRIEWTQISQECQKAHNSLKHTFVRGEGMILLSEQDIAKSHLLQGKLNAQYEQRQLDIQHMQQKFSFLSACCQHKKSSQLKASVSATASMLRRRQAAVDAAQANIIGFIQTQPKMGKLVALVDELKICDEQVMAEKQKVNHITIELKEAEAEEESLREEFATMQAAISRQNDKIAELITAEDSLRTAAETTQAQLQDLHIRLTAEDAKATSVEADISFQEGLLESYAAEEEVRKGEVNALAKDLALSKEEESRLDMERDTCLEEMGRVADSVHQLVQQAVVALVWLSPKFVEFRFDKAKLVYSSRILNDLLKEEKESEEKLQVTMQQKQFARGRQDLLGQENVSRSILEEGHLCDLRMLCGLFTREFNERSAVLKECEASTLMLHEKFDAGREALIALKVVKKTKSRRKESSKARCESLGTPPLHATPTQGPKVDVNRSASVSSSATRRRFRRFFSPTARERLDFVNDPSTAQAKDPRTDSLCSHRPVILPAKSMQHEKMASKSVSMGRDFLFLYSPKKKTIIAACTPEAAKHSVVANSNAAKLDKHPRPRKEKGTTRKRPKSGYEDNSPGVKPFSHPEPAEKFAGKKKNMYLDEAHFDLFEDF